MTKANKIILIVFLVLGVIVSISYKDPLLMFKVLLHTIIGGAVFAIVMAILLHCSNKGMIVPLPGLLLFIKRNNK